MQVFLSFFFFQRFTTILLFDMKMAEELKLVPKASFGFNFVSLLRLGKPTDWLLADPNARDTKMYVCKCINIKTVNNVKWWNIINTQSH